MFVVDNFVPYTLQEQIKHTLLVEDFPWFYVNDITSLDGSQQRPAFSHLIYDDFKKVSNLDIDYLAHFGAYQVDFPLNGIKRAKTLLQLPLNLTFSGYELDHLHVDMPEAHLVVLYYVIDADGDTIICDHAFDGTERKNLQAENFKVIEKVTPKQGRAVIFDGRYYHTAEQPKNGMRCIINLNVV